MNEKLLEYIKKSPTPFHACGQTAQKLAAAGYTELFEGQKWNIEKGCGYFVRRNGSSLIAFRAPKESLVGFMISASHDDSPCLKIKENASLSDSRYTRLSTEIYGGPIYSTWLDRPLGIAGRVCVAGEKGLEQRLVDSVTPCAIIPNVAIHMNRQINSGYNFNAAVDMIPLYDGKNSEKSFEDMVAELANAQAEDVISSELYVYNCQDGAIWGSFVSSPRLDDLQCAYATLEGFLAAKESASTPVYALFDNEEVGSSTKQGAASTFLCDTLERLALAVGADAEEYKCALANSLMLSCDNAHAVHPNHPEYADKNHTVRMNGGIVVKYNASQKYTSDAVSAGLVKLICKRAGVPYQTYANRADMPGGSTLGNISNTQVSINTVDIGLAQLAMHSSYETAGGEDTAYMVRAVTQFYSSALKMTDNGYELI